MINTLRKEGDYISNFEEAFKKIVDEEAEKRMKQGIIQVAKKMIKNNFTEEQIELTTNLSKKEIEKLKLQVV